VIPWPSFFRVNFFVQLYLVLRHLCEYISGNPTIVVEFIDGGGGRRAVNHAYRSAQPDGLTVRALSRSIIGRHARHVTVQEEKRYEDGFG
jgi:hypothetical protein